jgi:hypothetical protein
MVVIIKGGITIGPDMTEDDINKIPNLINGFEGKAVTYVPETPTEPKPDEIEVPKVEIKEVEPPKEEKPKKKFTGKSSVTVNAGKVLKQEQPKEIPEEKPKTVTEKPENEKKTSANATKTSKGKAKTTEKSKKRGFFGR